MDPNIMKQYPYPVVVINDTLTICIDERQHPHLVAIVDWLEKPLLTPEKAESVPIKLITTAADLEPVLNHAQYSYRKDLQTANCQRAYAQRGRSGFALAGGPEHFSKFDAKKIQKYAEHFVMDRIRAYITTHAATLDGFYEFLSMVTHDWLNIIAYRLFCEDSDACKELSLWNVFRHGYLPITWRGIWPAGYCIAFCPPSLSPANLPSSCRPTHMQLAAAMKRPKPPKRKPTRDIPVVPESTWPDRHTTDVVPAFIRHFGVLATTVNDRKILARLASRVQRFRHEGRRLLIEFDAGLYGMALLTCKLPYTGDIDRLPSSVARVMRLHDGMFLSLYDHVELEWFSFTGETFDMDWSQWHVPDPEDVNDPYPTTPLVPIKTGDGIYLIHPTATLHNGEPRSSNTVINSIQNCRPPASSWTCSKASSSNWMRMRRKRNEMRARITWSRITG